MIKGTPKQFDRRWLDGATSRTLVHWIAALDLDPELCLKGDRFIDWAKRCGRDIREMDEGGIVLRNRGGSFFYLNAEQTAELDSELTTLLNAPERL